MIPHCSHPVSCYTCIYFECLQKAQDYQKQIKYLPSGEGGRLLSGIEEGGSMAIFNKASANNHQLIKKSLSTRSQP